jgi:hypothetical protein
MGRRGPFAVTSLVALACCSGSGQDPKKETPERIVQEQVEAYNRHDLDAFLGFYSPEIKLYDFPDKEISSGLDEMRKVYGKLFADNPELKVDIVKRIIQGDILIDQESIVGAGRRRSTAIAIYRVREGKIATVWFVE